MRKQAALPARMQEFDIFWRHYPRKIAKGRAREAWYKASLNGLPEIGELLGIVERQAARWNDPKFIPHPATWLNDERWEDEDTVMVDMSQLRGLALLEAREQARQERGE